MPNWWDDNDPGYGGGYGGFAPGGPTPGSFTPGPVEDPAPPAQAPPQYAGGDGDPIVALYRQYYGRDPNAEELAIHQANINAGRGSLGDIEAELARTATVRSGAPAAGSGAPAAGGAFDMNAFGQYWAELTASGDGSMQDFNTRVLPALKARFPQIKTFGSKGDKIELPGGMWFDAVVSAGAGGKGYNAFNPLPMGQGDGGGGGGAYAAPWEKPFTPPPAFVAPTMEQVMAAPGFQFRMAEGQKALERSASAKGVLNTTGTMKDVAQFAQDYASAEYDKEYNRAVAEDQAKYSRAFGEYGLARENFWANQDRPFDKFYKMANLGFGAIGGLGSLGANYGSNLGNIVQGGAGRAGDYWTQGANARAAGQVGSANAWQSAYGNFGQNAMDLGLYYANRRNQIPGGIRGYF